MDSEQSRAEGSWREVKYEEVKRAVERGDENAKTKLAWLKLSGLGGAEVDAKKAVELLEQRVADGDAEAMWMLGVCNELGIGCEQDVAKAERLYNESSSRGNVTGEVLMKSGERFSRIERYKRGSGFLVLEGL